MRWNVRNVTCIFGLRGTIEAHEKRHADHGDDALYKFQHPKDYTADSKPAEGKIDQFRKQKGLELALKNEIVEPADAVSISTDVGAERSATSVVDVSKQSPGTTVSQQGTGTSA